MTATYALIYPPRPDEKCPPALLSDFETLGDYMATVKKNGTNNLMRINSQRLICQNRYAEGHKAWKPSDHLRAFLAVVFPHPGQTILCSELLHSKTPHIKDTVFIHDILQIDGDSLVGQTYEARQKLLRERLLTDGIMRDPKLGTPVSHWVLADRIWLAKNYMNNFASLWAHVTQNQEDEGLVLKRRTAKLEPFGRPKSNSWWQIKCRKPTKVLGSTG